MVIALKNRKISIFISLHNCISILKVIFFTAKLPEYIFLEFSASWCSWCKKEIPSIRQAYERFKDSVVFITIHLDDNRDKWLKDLETHAVPWYCLTDLKAWKSPVAKAYNIAGVPNCFIIGKDGLIKAKELRREEITQQLEKLLII